MSYTKETLDQYYKKWAEVDVEDIEKNYCEIMEYILKMKLDYSTQMKRVSHLYAIWVVAVLAYEQGIEAEQLGRCLNKFYVEYFSKTDCAGYEEYKKSMSSATKGVSSRRRRVNALLAFCKSNSVDINMTL